MSNAKPIFALRYPLLSMPDHLPRHGDVRTSPTARELRKGHNLASNVFAQQLEYLSTVSRDAKKDATVAVPGLVVEKVKYRNVEWTEDQKKIFSKVYESSGREALLRYTEARYGSTKEAKERYGFTRENIEAFSKP